jgi:hypothetical protein
VQWCAGAVVLHMELRGVALRAHVDEHTNQDVALCTAIGMCRVRHAHAHTYTTPHAHARPMDIRMLFPVFLTAIFALHSLPLCSCALATHTHTHTHMAVPRPSRVQCQAVHAQQQLTLVAALPHLQGDQFARHGLSRPLLSLEQRHCKKHPGRWKFRIYHPSDQHLMSGYRASTNKKPLQNFSGPSKR